MSLDLDDGQFEWNLEQDLFHKRNSDAGLARVRGNPIKKLPWPGPIPKEPLLVPDVPLHEKVPDWQWKFASDELPVFPRAIVLFRHKRSRPLLLGAPS